MRKYLKPILIFAIGLSLGIAGSVLLLESNSARNEDGSKGTTATEFDSPADSDDIRELRESHGTTSEVVVSLNDLTQVHDAFQRNHELYSKLANIGEDELASLLRKSNEVEHVKHREQIQVAIVRKLASTNPSSALGHIQELPGSSQSSLIYEVFQEWAASSVDDAVDEASSLRGSQRAHALRAILETRSDLSDIDVRQIGRKLGNETLALKLNTANKVAELIDQPERAWYFILNDETNDVAQWDLLKEVVEAWKDQKGFEVLLHIQEADFAEPELRKSLVRAIIEYDPLGAFTYVQEFPHRERTEMSRVIATCWASIDPTSAIESISSVEPLSLRESLLNSAVATWARSDPTDILDNIDKISSERRVDVLHFALHALASSSPHEALQRLKELKEYVGEDLYITESIVAAWSLDNPAEAVDWILTEHKQDKKRRIDLLDWALPRLVHENPYLAFEIAQEHSDESDWQLEVDVIRALTDSGQVEIAQEMLPRLRKDSRYSGYALVGISKVKNDEPDEVWRLAEELQGRERGLYYLEVFEAWTQFSGVQLFEEIQSLKSANARSLAARLLIRNNLRNPVLNESQIESAWTHLTDSDRASVERSINRRR